MFIWRDLSVLLCLDFNYIYIYLLYSIHHVCTVKDQRICCVTCFSTGHQLCNDAGSVSDLIICLCILCCCCCLCCFQSSFEWFHSDLWDNYPLNDLSWWTLSSSVGHSHVYIDTSVRTSNFLHVSLLKTLATEKSFISWSPDQTCGNHLDSSTEIPCREFSHWGDVTLMTLERLIPP